jgi:23S rRNA (adenine2503-C2)-methyltransferase
VASPIFLGIVSLMHPHDARKPNLLGMTFDDLVTALSTLQEAPYRVRQVFAGLYKRRAKSWAEFTDLSKPLRQKLANHCAIQYPALEQRFTSRDGTRRYLFSVGPGEKIESVLIPEETRDTLCISTQVGCALGCQFCLTAKIPLRRNLSAGEIISQILILQDDRPTELKQLNVVIMGMGEPLNNYDNVLQAIRLMTDKRGVGLSTRRITLSTAGVVPGIRRLAGEPDPPNLAISLNATTDEIRDQLMPINRKWNIAELIGACKEFPLERRRRITFEYVLIAGVNDSPADARRLAHLLADVRRKVNLIPLNQDPWLPFKSPDEARIQEFLEILAGKNITASVRRPRGDDISAACGMLAGKEHAATGCQESIAALPPREDTR